VRDSSHCQQQKWLECQSLFIAFVYSPLKINCKEKETREVSKAPSVSAAAAYAHPPRKGENKKSHHAFPFNQAETLI